MAASERLEEARAAYQRRAWGDDVRGASRWAVWLAILHFQYGDPAQGGGWMARAERLLEAPGLECPAHGLLRVPVALQAPGGGDPDTAHQMFREVAAVGDRFEDPDLAVMGRLGQGQALVAMGEAEPGLAMLDDAMVAVATGSFGRPHTPAFADDLDPDIVQLHSSEYRNPSDLRPGQVLVVGAAHSGADIALEVARAGHGTILAGRDTGEIPIDIEGPARRVASRVLPFVATRVLSLRTPIGRRARPKVRAHGGPLIRVKG